MPRSSSFISSGSSWPEFFRRNADKKPVRDRKKPMKETKDHKKPRHGRAQKASRLPAGTASSSERSASTPSRSRSISIPRFPRGVARNGERRLPAIEAPPANVVGRPPEMRQRHLERKSHLEKAQKCVDLFCSDIFKMIPLLSDNIILTIPDQTQKIPFAGIFNGKRQVEELFEKYLTYAKMVTYTQGETFCNRNYNRIIIPVDIHQRQGNNKTSKTIRYACRYFFSFDFDSSHQVSRLDIALETGPLALFFMETSPASLGPSYNGPPTIKARTGTPRKEAEASIITEPHRPIEFPSEIMSLGPSFNGPHVGQVPCPHVGNSDAFPPSPKRDDELLKFETPLRNGNPLLPANEAPAAFPPASLGSASAFPPTMRVVYQMQ